MRPITNAMAIPRNKKMTSKQEQALKDLSEKLDKDIPGKVYRSGNPKRAANDVLLKWSDEWGRKDGSNKNKKDK